MDSLTTIGGILDIFDNDILDLKDHPSEEIKPIGAPFISLGGALTDEDGPIVLKIKKNDTLTNGDAEAFAALLGLVETQYNIGQNAKD